LKSFTQSCDGAVDEQQWSVAKESAAGHRCHHRGWQQVLSHYCAACHGLDDQNTGVPVASRMSPPVPLLSGKDVEA
jgi:hypothetical protein